MTDIAQPPAYSTPGGGAISHTAADTGKGARLC